MDSSMFNHHPTGMLDRDQRTALSAPQSQRQQLSIIPSHPYIGSNDSSCHNCLNNKRNCLHSTFVTTPTNAVSPTTKCDICSSKDTKTTKFHNTPWNRRHRFKFLPKSCQKFSDSLLFICFFIWIFSVHLTSAKPTTMSQSNGDSRRKHPCGVPTQNVENNSIHNISELNGTIIVLTRICSSSLQKAREDIETFLELRLPGDDKQKYHETYSNINEDWLYGNNSELSIPNEYRKPFPEKDLLEFASDDFNVPQLKELFINSYSRLQRLIIGLNHTITDHKKKKVVYSHHAYNKTLEVFHKTENELQRVLCELHTGIEEMGLSVESIDSSVMPPKNMILEDALLNLRDYIIFREYIRQLEYLNSVLIVLKDRIARQNGETQNDE